MAPRHRIDWTAELNAIEQAAARAPQRRRRRVTLPAAIVKAVERQADREYGRWLTDMIETIDRLLAES
jgi:hypothetical protein